MAGGRATLKPELLNPCARNRRRALESVVELVVGFPGRVPGIALREGVGRVAPTLRLADLSGMVTTPAQEIAPGHDGLEGCQGHDRDPGGRDAVAVAPARSRCRLRRRGG